MPILLSAGNLQFAHGATPQLSRSTPGQSPPPQTNSTGVAPDPGLPGDQSSVSPSDPGSAGIRAPEPNAMHLQVPMSAPGAPIPSYLTPYDESELDYQRQIKHERQIRKQIDQRITSAFNSLIGTNVNALIMQWGAPSGEYKMSNGNMIYTWRNERSVPMPLDITQTGGDYFGIGGGSAMVSCTISIFTDSHETILSWKMKGNGC